MRLPLLNSISKPITVSGFFEGIGNNHLADMVNLNCSENCRTIKGRQTVMTLSEPPEQIINCGTKLFFRYNNFLKEVKLHQDGTLYEYGEPYELTDYLPAPDRILVEYKDGIYVFPDQIQIGVDKWWYFAENLPTGMTVPFINPRTLFYPENPNTTNFCADALALEVGMQFSFSWVSDEVYTIKTIELKTELSDDGATPVVTGRRVTLDKNVPNYNSAPLDAVVKFRRPKNRPIFNDLTVGYNHLLKFTDNRLIINSEQPEYKIHLDEYFTIGQRVDIRGSSVGRNDGYAKITDIKDNCLYFDEPFVTISEVPKTIVTITPVIPDFSHLIINENRLYGVEPFSYKLHISALNNPFLFYEDGKEPEDSWSVGIGALPTGITLWKDSVIFFTENGGFKILGSNATNFSLRQLSVNGIKEDFEASLCSVGDTLYYYSNKGVMKYSGDSDVKVFNSDLPVSEVKRSITYGTLIFMLTDERIWVYDTNTGLHWSENGENISQIFMFSDKRYLHSNGTVYLAEGNSDTSIDWSFRLQGIPKLKHKKLQPLYFTINYQNGTDCSFTLYCRPFGKTDWEDCGTYLIENEGSVKIPLQVGYCTGFEIKAEGNGTFAPQSWIIGYREVK